MKDCHMKFLKNPKFILLITCIALIIAARFLGLEQYINFENLKNQRESLVLFVQNNYTQSVIFYILLYVTIVSLSLPLAAVMTVAGGFLYGTFWGAVYANIGATSGAIIAFVVARYLLGNYIQNRYTKQLVRFNREFESYGRFYLLAVHFIAFVPFFIVNIAAALTNVSLWTFIWTTSVGIFPGSFVYTYAGQQLQTIDSIYDIFTPQIVILFFIIALLAVIPTVIMRTRKNGL